MAHLLKPCLVLSMALLVGCSTTSHQHEHYYPPADLVQDGGVDGPIRVAPMGNQGVEIGFSVGAIRRHGVGSVVREHPVKSILSAALAGYAVYRTYDYFTDDDTGQESQPSPASATASSGKRSVSLSNFSGDFDILIKDNVSGSGEIRIHGKQQ